MPGMRRESPRSRCMHARLLPRLTHVGQFVPFDRAQARREDHVGTKHRPDAQRENPGVIIPRTSSIIWAVLQPCKREISRPTDIPGGRSHHQGGGLLNDQGPTKQLVISGLALSSENGALAWHYTAGISCSRPTTEPIPLLRIAHP